jgi:hypothetical protein
MTKVTLPAAGIGGPVLAPNKWLGGCRLVNWTASPVYISLGISGTPAQGAPSDYVPAAAGGVPGVLEFRYVPRAGLMGFSTPGGDLTVVTW